MCQRHRLPAPQNGHQDVAAFLWNHPEPRNSPFFELLDTNRLVE